MIKSVQENNKTIDLPSPLRYSVFTRLFRKYAIRTDRNYGDFKDITVVDSGVRTGCGK